MKNKIFNNAAVLLINCLLLIAAGCSSLSKKGPPEIRTERAMAGTHLDAANKQSDRGNYTRALQMLEEGRRIAVAVDDPELLVQTSLSYGNIYYALGKENEAQVFWNDALRVAEEAKNIKLTAMCEIYMARYTILNNPQNSAVANDVKNKIQNALAVLEKNSLDEAAALTVAALAEKELRNWAASEAALKKAVRIHTKTNSLELAAYDWYLLASVYSTQNIWDRAIDAMQTAIALDRRAENSHGLGSDYLALGDIYKKAKDAANADAMYKRSLAIFTAARLENEAERVKDRLKTIGE